MPSRKKITLTSIFIFALCLLPYALVWAHGISEADKKAMLAGGNLQYIWLGATHMLTGYDHLLFIFGVIFFLARFRDIVIFITAFTAGHSLTLLFATIWGISANYYLVDAVIAVSVIYKGFENLDGFKKYIGVKAPDLLWVVFVFGLIHGFGLSTRLQELPLGKSGFVARILSFNLGVELGQIAALSIMLVIITSWRKHESFEKLSNASNVGLIIAGGLLFLMQMHGYLHSTAHHGEFDPIKKQRKHHHKGHSHKHSHGESHGHKGHSHGKKGHSHKHSHNNKTHTHSRGKKGHTHSHGQEDRPHQHKHGKKGHSHSHGKGHSHSHGDKGHSHGKKGHSHSHGKGHSHSHGKKGHSHGKNGHSHSHGKGHSHSHGKGRSHSHGKKGHTHSHGKKGHSHSHGKKGHSHSHSHGKKGHSHSHGKKGHSHSHGKKGHSHKH